MGNNRKIILSALWVVFSMVLVIISAYLEEYAVVEPVYAIAITVTSIILLFAAVFYAAKVDFETGVYECQKCGYVFKPTFKSYIWGAHTLRTRCLKCPNCEEKSWCKRKSVQ